MGGGEPTGTMPMAEVAGRLDAAVDGLVEVAAGLADVDPGPVSAGCDLPGVLGQLSGRLYRQWQESVSVRRSEVAHAADRLARTATLLRHAAERYRQVDDEVAGRMVRADGVSEDPAGPPR